MLLAGSGLYALVLIPGFLPHTIDILVGALAGLTIATVALVGFDSTRVSRTLAWLMVALGFVMLVTGIVLARQGHAYLLLLLSVPAIGLGLFGLRKLRSVREKEE